jgi:hypothetical protein
MDYIPSRKKFVSRSFDDLWQLCIDEPGGFFQTGDFEKDAKTAQAGPWQRCFAYSSVGQWRKCGGTCCDDLQAMYKPANADSRRHVQGARFLLRCKMFEGWMEGA